MSSDSRAAAAGNQSDSSLSSGALSRRAFLTRLDRAKADADSSAAVFSLCLVDVDQLRNVNDQHGQSSGDAVILTVARETLAALAAPEWRELESSLGRYDGDSFILLLDRCRLESAERFGETLRRRVSDLEIGPALRATVSIGVAAYRIGETIDALLARIEKTLHLAKQFGRDRVETAWTPQVRDDASPLAELGNKARDR